MIRDMLDGEATLLEKLMAIGSYATFGVLGFLFLLIGVTKTRFVTYHTYQSILVSLLYALISSAAEMATNAAIFLAKSVAAYSAGYVSYFADLLDWTLFVGVIATLIYCAIFAALGRFSYLKFISEQIYRMLP